MSQSQFPYSDKISPDDWEMTPSNVKAWLKELLEQDLERQKTIKVKNSTNKRILIIVIPSFNDWAALEKLLLLIDQISLCEYIEIQVVIVDDYSTDIIPETLTRQQHDQIKIVNILRLRRNLGHQRAIVIGLCYVYDNLDSDLIVVMDGDGEDNPFEIQRFLELSDRTGNNKVIFAKRSKRSEGYSFKFLYFVYRGLYRLLTGRTISVGNFSLLPASLLKNVVVVSEIWNHYSSGLQRSRLPYLEIDVPRTRRLDGQPKMNLVSLITHGLSSIAVYGDLVGTRILLGIIILLVFVFVILCIVVLIKFITDLAIPGWTTYAVGLLLLFALQLILIGTIFSMIILVTRNSTNIIPIRDYKYYVDTFFQLKP